MVVPLLVGTILGFLAGLGVGGGSLLILWLTFVVNMEPGNARFVNLLFFLPAALISCGFRWRQGSLDLSRIFPAIAAGSLGAGLCALLASRLDIQLLQKLFGILLILTGLRELFYRQRPRD